MAKLLKLLSMGLVITTPAMAADYFTSLQKMFTDASAPATFPNDFTRGAAYTNCIYVASSAPTVATATSMGICRSQTPNVGPAFPGHQDMIPCAAFDVSSGSASSYGFFAVSTLASDSSLTTESGALIVRVGDEVLSETKIAGKFLVFHRHANNGEIYGYCWKQ